VLVRDGKGRGAARRGPRRGKELQLEHSAIAATHARGVQVCKCLRASAAPRSYLHSSGTSCATPPGAV